MINAIIQKRNDILKLQTKEIENVTIFPGNIGIKSRNQLHQIIDTTLLKCYLIVGIVLVLQIYIFIILKLYKFYIINI